MERKHIGAHNELIATVWLLKHGYEVFRNVSSHGIIDLVAFKAGEFSFFDVKGRPYSADGSPTKGRITEDQAALGIKCLFVYPDGQCLIEENPQIVGDINKLYICARCGKKFSHDRYKMFCSKICAGVIRRARLKKHQLEAEGDLLIPHKSNGEMK